MSNDPKILEMTADNGFRNKVQAVLDVLKAKGYPDAAIIEGMRTKEQQAEKVRLGYSKTMKSQHLKRGSDGKGLAADITPRSTLWNSPKRYWLMLGWLCYRHGLGWGGLFGISAKQKAKVLEQMKLLSDEGWPEHSTRYEVQTGWDPAHLQKDRNW